MSNISLTIPGAVVTADTLEAIRERLLPFTLWQQQRRLSAYHSRVESGEVDGISSVIQRAMDQIAEGGWVSLAHFEVTNQQGDEYQWVNDENAPLEMVEGSLKSRVSFENRQASIAVVVETAPQQARVHVSTHFGIPSNKVVRVDFPGYESATIANAVREILSENIVIPGSVAAISEPFRVFIGHGGDSKWESVRDFIQDAGYDVDYFEGGDRFGQSTFEVVERMIAEAAVAVIVMTGVDTLADGRKLARQNVVHELGFAHGRLGARHTLILLESGTEEPTNIAGVTQVRFPQGDINQSKRDVLAALANRKRDRASGS